MIIGQKKDKERPWHPDFREINCLPDIKWIRTRFLLNCASISFLFISAIFFWSEFSATQIYRDGIHDSLKYINQSESKNSELITLNSEFVKKSAFTKIFNEYFYPEINVLDYLLIIQSSKLYNLELSTIDFEKKEEVLSRKDKKKKDPENYHLFTIKGVINGNYETSIDNLNKYMENISNNELVKKSLKGIEMTSLKRDDQTEAFTYQIELTLKA